VPLLRQVVARERNVQLGEELPNLIGDGRHAFNREVDESQPRLHPWRSF
jgi:hypothetical protein